MDVICCYPCGFSFIWWEETHGKYCSWNFFFLKPLLEMLLFIMWCSRIGLILVHNQVTRKYMGWVSWIKLIRLRICVYLQCKVAVGHSFPRQFSHQLLLFYFILFIYLLLLLNFPYDPRISDFPHISYSFPSLLSFHGLCFSIWICFRMLSSSPLPVGSRFVFAFRLSYISGTG